MNFIENCVVLNATGVEWMDVKQHTVGDVTCCEDLMITMAICERRKGSKYAFVKNIRSILKHTFTRNEIQPDKK